MVQDAPKDSELGFGKILGATHIDTFSSEFFTYGYSTGIYQVFIPSCASGDTCWEGSIMVGIA